MQLITDFFKYCFVCLPVNGLSNLLSVNVAVNVAILIYAKHQTEEVSLCLKSH